MYFWDGKTIESRKILHRGLFRIGRMSDDVRVVVLDNEGVQRCPIFCIVGKLFENSSEGIQSFVILTIYMRNEEVYKFLQLKKISFIQV